MTDLIIIGAGPGGYELALEAAKEGLEVILIEKEALGGTCLNYGCIPTKSYFKNALFLHGIKDATTYGVDVKSWDFDFKKVKERKDQVVSSLKKQIEFALKKLNVKTIYGKARLVNKNQVEVNDEVYEAKNIVIAIGSKSKSLPIEGNDLMVDERYLLNIDDLPKHLIIVGGGVIGIEFASIFSTFNVKVSVVEYMDNILPNLDEELSKKIKLMLKKQGIDIYNNALVTKVSEVNGEKIVLFKQKDKELSLQGDVVLKAVGRVGNLESLNLEDIGIETYKGFIKVDQDYQTNKEGIYAIGDCNGLSLLAHSATFQGFHVLNRILERRSAIDFNLIPSAIFTIPPIASIGLSEQDAKIKEINYQVKKTFYKANGKALAMNESDGFAKILIDDNNNIIGAHILGAEADTIIHEVVALMNNKVKVNQIGEIIHAHPTLSEIILSLVR
ncbi:TPA: dihydrolipoyl dehydrogenase [bacterium]|jgi:dihydrolipoamide dehydrogenase|nr:dihydrolipoyl dehydrogenase [bacterium]